MKRLCLVFAFLWIAVPLSASAQETVEAGLFRLVITNYGGVDGSDGWGFAVEQGLQDVFSFTGDVAIVLIAAGDGTSGVYKYYKDGVSTMVKVCDAANLAECEEEAVGHWNSMWGTSGGEGQGGGAFLTRLRSAGCSPGCTVVLATVEVGDVTPGEDDPR